MNAFADTLLSLVFGWMRRLVEGIFSFVSSGQLRGMFSWLGDHWLWLVLVLCIGCTVLDYLIWLLRWQPYILWRNKLRRLFGKSPKASPVTDEFEYGYNDGVDVDISDVEAAQPLPAEAYAYENWQPVYEEPADVMPEILYDAIPEPQPEEPLQSPSAAHQRNRRSQRYDKRKFRLSGILPTASDEESALLDGLPPAVNKSEAFHAPVYPESYDNSQG